MAGCGDITMKSLVDWPDANDDIAKPTNVRSAARKKMIRLIVDIMWTILEAVDLYVQKLLVFLMGASF